MKIADNGDGTSTYWCPDDGGGDGTTVVVNNDDGSDRYEASDQDAWGQDDPPESPGPAATGNLQGGQNLGGANADGGGRGGGGGPLGPPDCEDGGSGLGLAATVGVAIVEPTPLGEAALIVMSAAAIWDFLTRDRRNPSSRPAHSPGKGGPDTTRPLPENSGDPTLFPGHYRTGLGTTPLNIRFKGSHGGPDPPKFPPIPPLDYSQLGKSRGSADQANGSIIPCVSE